MGKATEASTPLGNGRRGGTPDTVGMEAAREGVEDADCAKPSSELGVKLDGKEERD